MALVTGGETLLALSLMGSPGNKTCTVSASRPPYPRAGILESRVGQVGAAPAVGRGEMEMG